MKLNLEGLRLVQGAFELRADAAFGKASVGIAGPSGSGKTTLLELVAGLRRSQAGRLSWNGRLLDDPSHGLRLPARDRRMGYVPQDADLFPHLGVRANLCFGQARAAGRGPGLEEVAGMMGLDGLLDRAPASLSGGERRRVALGRALLAGSELLLLDEPFTGLDTQARKSLRAALKTLRRRAGIPMILVSHDEKDFRELCGKVVKMKDGVLKAGQ